MKTKQLGYLFAVFATFIAADAFAFDVTPTPFTGDEGTQHALSIKVGADDWEPIIESNLCSGFEYQFRISLITTGNATWASNQFSGDINLDQNGQAFSLTQQIVLCSNNASDITDNSFSLNLHTDEVGNEGTENATLDFEGQCNIPQEVVLLSTPTSGGKNPKIQATQLCLASVTANIVDTTVVMEASISASDAAEPGSNGQFTILLSKPALGDGLMVTYSVTASSTATPASASSGLGDYEALGSSIIIPPGNSSAVIPVVVIDDDLVEGPETVVVDLVFNETYELGTPSTATVTIVDDDNLPMASISASRAAEPGPPDGNDGSFTISLDEPAPDGGLVVNYLVSASSTATASSDYEALGSSVTIPAGATSVDIPVVVIDDTLVEGSESVIVDIQADTAYDLGSPATATVFIVDDDRTPLVSISAADGAEPSANGMFTFTLTRPAPVGGLTVNYAVSGSSTATASDDYQALGSSVTIPADETSVDVPVMVVDDEIAELAETVIVDIQENAAYELGAPATAVVSIIDDDTAGVHVSGSSLVVSEDGTSDQFSVVLTSLPEADVNISVSSGNTAEGTVDNAMLVFNATNWDSQQTVTVTGVDDDLDDGDVNFNITLMAASSDSNYAAIGPIDVAVTNHDNDEPAAASFTQESYPFTEDVGAAEITIERAGVIGEEVSVTFSTDDGASGTTATAGEDYTPVNEVLVWAANDDSARTVAIPIINDASSEGDETVVLKLEVNGSDLPASFSEMVIQNDFIEDVLDKIDLDKLPPNQKSITAVILTACPTGLGQGGFQELCNDLIGEALAGGSVGNPLKQITPEQSAAARAPAAETVTVQNINVNGRMAALRAGATGFSASGFSFNLAGFNLNSGLFKGAPSGYDSIQPGFVASNAAAAGSDDSFDDFGRWGIFVSGRAVFGEKDSTRDESGYDFDTAGLTIGVDYRFTDKLVGGVAFGYSDNNVKIQGSSGRLDTKGLTATIYGSYYPTDNFYLDASLSAGSNDYDQLRKVDYSLSELGAVVSETFKTDYDGDQNGLTLGTGYDFFKNGWTFGPTLFVEYIDITIDAYDEKLVDGVAGFDLGWATHIKKQGYESLIPSIGFQFSKAWSKSWGVIVPQGHVSWAKELKNDDTIISGYFLGDTGKVNFNLLTDALDEDFFKAGLGFSAMFQNNKSAFLMVDGDFGRDLLSVYYINAGFRWEF